MQTFIHTQSLLPLTASLLLRSSLHGCVKSDSSPPDEQDTDGEDSVQPPLATPTELPDWPERHLEFDLTDYEFLGKDSPFYAGG